MKNTFLFTFIASIAMQAQTKTTLLVGTYTNSCKSNGIYVYEFDTKTGEISLKNQSEPCVNPSFLSISADKKKVYAVHENGENSTVSAYNFTFKSGKLDLINSQKVDGKDPCYLINDATNVITANYSSGNINVFGKNADGSLNGLKQKMQHFGKSTNASRQEAPHAHMVYFSPDKKFVFSNDLGADKIYIYNYDAQNKKTPLAKRDSVAVTPGNGPRHLIFGKNNKNVYVLQELTGKITAYSYNKGKISQIDKVSLLATGFTGKFKAADIHISSDGNFLYASNRVESNTISIFKIQTNGKLISLGHFDCGGLEPRNFTIDPSGKYLLVGNQLSNEIVVFKRNQKTGLLSTTNNKISICEPVCLVFVP